MKMGGYVELERPAGLEGKQLEEMEKLGTGMAKR